MGTTKKTRAGGITFHRRTVAGTGGKFATSRILSKGDVQVKTIGNGKDMQHAQSRKNINGYWGQHPEFHGLQRFG